MNKHYLAETERECLAWPDASCAPEDGGKHGRIILRYKGESRIIVVSNTPSDARAIKNHLALVKRELRGMGASRTVVPINPNQRERERNKPVRIDMPLAPHPALNNPFDNLESIMTQPNSIASIFAAIDKLRYSEMLTLAAFLSHVAQTEKLRRSNVYDWARTLQSACDESKAAPVEQRTSSAVPA